MGYVFQLEIQPVEGGDGKPQPLSGLSRQSLLPRAFDTHAGNLQWLAQIMPGYCQQLRKQFSGAGDLSCGISLERQWHPGPPASDATQSACCGEN
jgi:hypothetical protein